MSEEINPIQAIMYKSDLNQRIVQASKAISIGFGIDAKSCIEAWRNSHIKMNLTSKPIRFESDRPKPMFYRQPTDKSNQLMNVLKRINAYML